MTTVFSELQRSLALIHPIELYIHNSLVVCQTYALGYNAQGKISCVLRLLNKPRQLNTASEWLSIEVEKVSCPRLLAISTELRPLDNKLRPRLYKEVYSLNF